MTIKEQLELERNEIVACRNAHPFEPQARLAKRIASDDIPLPSGSLRQFYSIYSVIRRHDAKVKAAWVKSKPADR